MKNTNYKIKSISILFGAMLALTANTYASEVTGTISTGLGNNSVNGIVISAPTASLAGGTYIGNQNVSLSSSGSLSIRYTTDGSTPTCGTDTTYSSAISVASSQTVKAISCYANSITSSVSSFLYTITPASGGGGGGGGGGSYIPPVVTTTTVATTTATTTQVTQPAPVGQVLGASSFNFLKDLKMGVRGADVTELQKILIAGGFLNSEATGYFGVLTKSALMKWQAKNGLPVTGIFDKKSRDFLAPKTENQPTATSTPQTSFVFLKDLKLGDRGNDVTELQKVLIAEGFLNSDATGYFGAMTKTALMKWQVKNGLPGTGFFGPLSRAKLNK